MIMVSFGKIFSLPFENFGKTIVGTGVYIIPAIVGLLLGLAGIVASSTSFGAFEGVMMAVNILVGAIIIGYFLSLIRGVIKKRFVMPEWSGISSFLGRGLLAYIITFVWWIPFIVTTVIALGTVGTVIFAGLASGNSAAIAGALSSIGLGIVPLFFLGLFTVYVYPSAIISFASTNNFGNGFAIGTVFKKAFSGSYFVGWILSGVTAIVIIISLAILSIPLMFIPVIGGILLTILSSLAIFILNTFMWSLLSEGWEKA